MHFEGSEAIRAPVDAVWAFFMDAPSVAGCAPGFQKMEVLSPEHYKPTVAVGVGPVKATFTLDVTLTDLRPPHHATMRGHGIAAGSGVDLESQLDLAATGESSTSLAWTMDAVVSGAIASMGARLLENTAQKVTARFFECVREKLGTAPR
ncbi:MAG TPA: carbon monoxide dehydrogenase subunit G [Chloroflexota bacterium]|nr:carbon monoxide dehydrogenase subunit G [Chloroflexota bacterium]